MLMPYFDDCFRDNGLSKGNLGVIYGRATGFLDDLLRYGDEALAFCHKFSKEKPRHADHAVLAFSRHLFAHLDGVKLLLAVGAVDGCKPLLRSMLEATFSLAYITRDHSDERGLAYQVFRIKEKIQELRRVDVTHPLGKQLQSELKGDKWMPGILGKMPEGLSKKADEMEKRLNTEAVFAPILKEWERVKLKKDPKWFTLFSGEPPVRSVRELAKHLKWLAFYDFFYSEWSDTVHAGDALENYSTADNFIRPLRYPAEYAKAMSTAFVIFSKGVELVATFYEPSMGKSVYRWVNQRLAPVLRALVNTTQKSLDDYR